MEISPSGRTQQQPALRELLAEPIAHPALVFQPGLGLPVAHQLHGEQKPQPANVAHDRMVGLHPLQLVLEIGPNLGGVLDQTLGLDDLDVLQPSRRRDGMSRRREDVGHGASAREQVRHLSLNHGGPQGQVAAGDALGHRHHVWHHVPMVYPEPPASPAKPAYDLVVDKQHPVLVADFADHRPILVAWAPPRP